MTHWAAIILACVVLAAIWSLLELAWNVRKERRRRVERRRDQARALRDAGYPAVHPYRIGSPSDPLFDNPADQAAYDRDYVNGSPRSLL
jgi:hypothetical protein